MRFQIPPIFDGPVHAEAERFAEARSDAAGTAAAELWAEICSLGWPLTILPDDVGGVGAELADLAAIVEGAGRHALALPLAGACAVVPLLLLAADDRQKMAAVVARMAENEWRVAPILPEAVEDLALTGSASSGYVLHGKVRCVHALPDTTHLLAVLDDPQDGPVLLLLPVGAPGLQLSSKHALDGRLTLDVFFESMQLGSDAILAAGEQVATAVDKAVQAGTMLTCVEMMASLGRILEQTVGYLGERTQFGETLSSFQALRHRVADGYARYLNARALVEGIFDSLSLSEPSRNARDVSMAKFLASGVGRDLVHDAIQLHGGMGMTEELAISKLNKRVLMAGFEFGDRDHHLARLDGTCATAT